MNLSNLSATQASSAAHGILPSTPARELQTLRTRSPQQPSPGFVLTGSDSRRRIIRQDNNPSRPTSPTVSHAGTRKKTKTATGSGTTKNERVEVKVMTNRKLVVLVLGRKQKKTPKATKDKLAPAVVDVDQASSSDEVVESHLGTTEIFAKSHFGNFEEKTPP